MQKTEPPLFDELGGVGFDDIEAKVSNLISCFFSTVLDNDVATIGGKNSWPPAGVRPRFLELQSSF